MNTKATIKALYEVKDSMPVATFMALDAALRMLEATESHLAWAKDEMARPGVNKNAVQFAALESIKTSVLGE